MIEAGNLIRKVCVFGAGAIGLDLAQGLIRAGHDVSIVARGNTLNALKNQGFVHHSGIESRHITPDQFTVCDIDIIDCAQDYVFLTVKADSLVDVSASLPPFLGDATVVVSMTNGIPPWYSYLQDNTIGRFPFTREPRKTFFRNVEPHRVIGAIVQRSVHRDFHSRIEVYHTSGSGYRLGEPSHEISDRICDLQMFLISGGFSADTSTDIHSDIWKKLLGNICVNPLSVITESSIGEMLERPEILSIMKAIVDEALHVGLALGVIKQDDFNIEDFLRYAKEHLYDHETSMLRDFRSGNSLESGRILHAVIMLAELCGVKVPELKKISLQLDGKTMSKVKVSCP